MINMPTLDRIAKTINGPNETSHVDHNKLEELQDTKYGQLHAQRKAGLLRTAYFVQQLFLDDPDGWVITNGDDTKCRTIDTSSEYVGGNAVAWTDSIENAMQFARRFDAERFCEDDEDAWHIRRVSEVAALWVVGGPLYGALTTGTGAPQQGSPDPAIQSTGAAPTPPQPSLPPADRRGVEHLLQLFRAFVTHNATQWAMGAGDHHHPMWVDVATQLDQYDLNYDPSMGPDYAYIQPLNRKPYGLLLEEYADQTNT